MPYSDTGIGPDAISHAFGHGRRSAMQMARAKDPVQITTSIAGNKSNST